MIDHYNAFISYRHADKDIKIAETIQRDLEHFHIPAKIRKKTGMKRIQRIFRDKDELGTASDLSVEIAYALEHSDYLIVICSTVTKQSSWVPREIAYFLQFHPRSHVLTVLVDGEDPNEVIPDILRYEDRVFQNEYGQSYTMRFPLEPLSCDYRLPHRQARKEELPRLASALIGCSYDELMNRRRQYAIRRLSLIFTGIMLIVLAFGGYMFFARKKIQENYDASLRNKSLYLANESSQAYEREQRILALQLALEALPADEEDPRPVTPQAIRAITDATLAYVSLAGDNIAAEWNYAMGNPIKDFCLSPNGGTLAAYDVGGNIRVWNTNDRSVLFTLPPSKEGLHGIRFASSGDLIAWNSKYVQALDPVSGQVLWTYTSGDDYIRAEKFDELADGSLFFSTGDLKFIKLSGADGSLLKTYEIPKELTDLESHFPNSGLTAETASLTLVEHAISPDETRIAAICYLSGSYKVILVYNLNTGNLSFYPTAVSIVTESFRNPAWVDDSHLMIANAKNALSSSSSIGNANYVKKTRTAMLCIDPGSMAPIWTSDFYTTDVNLESGFIYLKKNNAVCYFEGNISTIYDMETGEIIGNHYANDPIIYAEDTNGNGWPIYITQNGNLGLTGSADILKLIPTCTGDLTKALIKNAIYALPDDSNEIYYYGLHVSDPEWTEVGQSKTLSLITLFSRISTLDNGALAILTDEPVEKFPGVITATPSPEEEKYGTPQKTAVLTLVDPISGEIRYQIPLTDANGGTTSASHYTLLGSANNSYLFAETSITDKTYNLISIDFATGKKEVNGIFETYTSAEYCASLVTGVKSSIIFVNKDDKWHLQIGVYNLTTKETSFYPLGIEETGGYPNMPPLYLPELNAAFYSDKDFGDWIVYFDGSPAEKVEYPSDWLSTKYAAYNAATGHFAFAADDRVILTTLKGDTPILLTGPGANPSGLLFVPPGKKDEPPTLLVTYQNGTLYRYNAENGNFLGQSDYIAGTLLNRPAEFQYNAVTHRLYVQTGLLTTVYETDTWVELAVIQDCFGHHELTDRFYTFSYTDTNENHIGYFHQYSTQELIQKARDILQGAEMSDETKTQYGIEIEEETP